MGAAPVLKFVLSLALDFPDICPQFFLGNLILVGKNEKKLHTTLYIFTRLLNRQNGIQNSDSIWRPPSNKRSLFRISAPFKCV